MVKDKKSISSEQKDILPDKEITESEKEKAPAESFELPTESKELDRDQDAHKKARAQIESIDLDDSLKAETQAQASSIQSLEPKEKIEKLLQAAKEKGVIFAVHMAKSMDDPYILDMLHDVLVKEGYYKEFLK